jgi:hypothetical protein
MGVLFGGFIIVTNASTFLRSSQIVPMSWLHVTNLVLVVLWIVAIVYRIRSQRRQSTVIST